MFEEFKNQQEQPLNGEVSLLNLVKRLESFDMRNAIYEH